MNPIISARIKFINFFGMIFLVMIHSFNLTNDPLYAKTVFDLPLNFTNFTEYFLANGLLRFRVPLFMLISGYLFAYKDTLTYWETIKKKFKTLYVPFLMVSGIALIVVFIIELAFYQSQTEGFWGAKISDTSIKNILYTWLVSPIPFQLWFLKTLFVFFLFTPAIKFCLGKSPLPFLTLLLVIRVIFMSSHYSLLFYFASGIFIYNKKYNISTILSKSSTYQLLILIMSLLLIKTFIAFRVLLMPENITTITLQILQTLHAIATIILVWFGLDKWVNATTNTKWFQYVSGTSFFIYAFHEPLTIKLIKPTINLLQGVPGAKLIAFCLLPIIVVTFCIFLDKLISAVFPGFYAIITGNRGSLRKLILPKLGTKKSKITAVS